MNPYKVLGVEEAASDDTIKAAYRRLAKEAHPDTPTGSEEAFRMLHLAYQVLIDPKKRKLYDEQGVILDDSPDAIERMVNKRIRDITNAWLDKVLAGEESDIAEFVVGMLEEGIEAITKSNSKCVLTLGKLKEVRAKLKKKEGGEGIVHHVLDQRRDTLNAGMAQNEDELKILKRLIEIVNEYEYDYEKPEEVWQELHNFTIEDGQTVRFWHK